jgi:hypothetical protein
LPDVDRKLALSIEGRDEALNPESGKRTLIMYTRPQIIASFDAEALLAVVHGEDGSVDTASDS